MEPPWLLVRQWEPGLGLLLARQSVPGPEWLLARQSEPELGLPLARQSEPGPELLLARQSEPGLELLLVWQSEPELRESGPSPQQVLVLELGRGLHRRQPARLRLKPRSEVRTVRPAWLVLANT